jgi:perosamine synthetase
MITVSAITNLEELDKLKPVWDELLSRSDSDFPFLTFEWLSCWWQSYGRGSELLVLVAKENDEIVGLAPLMRTVIKHRVFKLKAITFIANYQSNRSAFILLKDKMKVLNAFMEYLENNYSDACVWLFDFLVKGSDNDLLFSELLHLKKMRTVKMASSFSPYIKISLDWDDYLRSISKNMRQKLHSIKNIYKRIGNYEIIKYTDRDLDKAFDALLLISKKTWKFDIGTSIASSEDNIAFYRALLKVFSQKGNLRLWILKVDSKPIAFDFSLAYKKKTYMLKVGYDMGHSNISPGVFVNNAAIQDSFENGMTEYDFLGGDDSYKMKWTPLCREHAKYMVFGRRKKAHVLFLFEAYIASSIRLFRQSLKDISKRNVYEFPTSLKLFRSARPNNLTCADLFRPLDIRFYYSARNAIFNAVRSLSFSSTDNILMPSYHCGVEVDAVLKAQVKVVFYNVGRDCVADIEDIKKKIGPQTKALVVIHYFGFPQPIEALKALCKDKGLLLIEDCAHSLFSAHKGVLLGLYGDIGVFSVRKSLAVPEGGVLVMNTPSKLNIPATVYPNAFSVIRKIFELYTNNMNTEPNLKYSILNYLLFLPLRQIFRTVKLFMSKQTISQLVNDIEHFDVNLANIGISNLSKKVMEYSSSDGITHKRRENYLYLDLMLRKMPGIRPIFPVLPAGTCPLAYPVIVQDRDEMHEFFKQRGIFLYIFGKHLHDSLDSTSFTNSNYLSDSVICFPVHQDISKKNLDDILNCLSNYMSTRSSLSVDDVRCEGNR